MTFEPMASSTVASSGVADLVLRARVVAESLGPNAAEGQRRDGDPLRGLMARRYLAGEMDTSAWALGMTQILLLEQRSAELDD